MKVIFLLLVLLLLGSCDPFYKVVISNKSNNEISVITVPPIEKNKSTDAQEYDAILHLKTEKSDSITGYYKLSSGNELYLFTGLGSRPRKEYSPYGKLLIINKQDTLKIDKLNLIKTINKKETRRLLFYNIIEVK